MIIWPHDEKNVYIVILVTKAQKTTPGCVCKCILKFKYNERNLSNAIVYKFKFYLKLNVCFNFPNVIHLCYVKRALIDRSNY